MVVAMDNA